MKVVRFIKGYPPYNAGEVAGFPEEDADRLVIAGIAEGCEEAAEVKEARAPADKMVREAPNKAVRRR
jgi:hypothetical protein